MIFKRSFCFCIGTVLLAAVCVESKNNDYLDDSTLIGQLLARVSALEERSAIHESQIADLQNEVSNQKKDIGRMKQSMAAKDHRIRSIIHSMRRQETLVNPEKNTEMSERAADKSSFEQKEAAVRRIRQTVIVVAFSAALSKTISHPGTLQNIVFDYVFTNVGNGYNASNGVFDAPVPGTYLFFVTVRALQNHDVWVQFAVNGKRKSTTYAQSFSSVSDTSSQTIILQLKQGDEVTIELHEATGEIFGSDSLYSTFSGFLLSYDYTQPSNIIG